MEHLKKFYTFIGILVEFYIILMYVVGIFTENRLYQEE
jgi:hypothetical protein